MAFSIRSVTKKLLIFFNLLAAIFFLLGCYGHHLNQARFWFTGLFNLASFYLLLILVGFLFFWLVVKPRLSLISLGAMLLAWGPMAHLVQFRFGDEFNMEKNAASLRVMSWNVEHFEIATYKKKPESKQDMIRLINNYQPDIACFQEMVANENLPTAINYLPDFAKLLNMPYYYYSYNEKLDYDKDHHFGIVIFSRYPIAEKKTVSYAPNNYNSIFQYADVVKGKDTIRVFNLHLQSLRFSAEDRQYLDQPNIDEESNFRKSRNIISKFKEGFIKRKDQSDRIKREMNISPYPLIVCGDFNDVPNSYAYYNIGDGLTNSFVEEGSGIGRTFASISRTLRIDNIFVSPSLEVQQFKRVEKKLSDHFPIVTDLYYKKP